MASTSSSFVESSSKEPIAEAHVEDELAALPSHSSTDPAVKKDTSIIATTAATSTPSSSSLHLLGAAQWRILIVPIVCGLFYGTNMFVAVFFQMHEMGMDCSKATGGREVCESLPYADCRWYTNATNPNGIHVDGGGNDHHIGQGYCGWTDLTCRVLYPNSHAFGGSKATAKHACVRDDRCKWSYSSKRCDNPTGFDSLHSAMVAVSMTTGAALGSFFSSAIVERLGSKVSFLCAGVMACACCLMYHVAIATNDFWVLIAGRTVIGACIGITAVASPLYVDQNTEKHLKRPMGYVYVVSICTGMVCAAGMGLAVGQSINFAANRDAHVAARLQGVIGLCTAAAVALVVLGLCARETRINFNPTLHRRGATDVDPNEHSHAHMAHRLVLALVMACTYQLTGSNCISSYAPTIMKNLGVAPLVGTFLVMLVSLLASISSIFLATRATSRHIFLCGSFMISAACLFLCGIPVYPGVAADQVRNVVAVVGTLLYMACFQLCIGPCFYVLTQELFPLSFRPKGASFTQTAQFAMAVLVCASYPFATQGLSGGASGNQSRGQSIVFLFFGVLGFVCFAIQFFFLHPWKGADNAVELQEQQQAHMPTPTQGREQSHGDADSSR